MNQEDFIKVANIMYGYMDALKGVVFLDSIEDVKYIITGVTIKKYQFPGFTFDVLNGSSEEAYADIDETVLDLESLLRYLEENHSLYALMGSHHECIETGDSEDSKLTLDDFCELVKKVMGS